MTAEPVVAQPGTPRNLLHQQAMSGLTRVQPTRPASQGHVVSGMRGGDTAKVLTVYILRACERPILLPLYLYIQQVDEGKKWA